MKITCFLILFTLLLAGCVTPPGDAGKEKTLYKLENNLTSPPVSIPEVKKEVLENGLTVVLMERRELPLIHAYITFNHAGSAFDSDTLAGLANLTSSLLDKGTITKDAAGIADTLDFVGAKVSASCTKDTASVSLDILSEYTDLGLELFTDMVRNPSFSEEEISRTKQQVLSRILADRDEHDIFATQMFSEYVFLHHPYHRPVNGYESTIPVITRKDIQDFHKTHYIPNDAVLIIVGDFDSGELMNKIRTRFGTWTRGDTTFPRPGEVKGPLSRKVILINRDVSQTTVCIGHPGFKRMNPDFYPVLLLNQILGGGGLTSRVGKKVRTEMGLAYTTGTWFIPRREAGSFLAFAQTRNENAHLSVEAILGEIRRIREEPVSVEELHAAKSYFNGNFPLRFETNTDFAQTLYFIELYDMGLSYFKDYLEQVNNTTVADILRVAKEYLNTDEYIIVAVTKAEEVMEQFKAFGDVEVIE